MKLSDLSTVTGLDARRNEHIQMVRRLSYLPNINVTVNGDQLPLDVRTNLQDNAITYFKLRISDIENDLKNLGVTVDN